MHLSKTSGTPAGKAGFVEDGKAAKNAHAVKTPQASSTAVRSVLPGQSLASMSTSLGLPSDNLSASILSFARFFSLPLKPQLMADIRRQAFTQLFAEQPPAEAPQLEAAKQAVAQKLSDTTATVKNRETLSLAAAAAESKGVELDAKGLESYAQAVDPDWRNRQNSGGQNRRRRNKDQTEQKDDDAQIKPGSATDSAAAGTAAFSCDAASLEKTALESAGKNPLLSILNRLPGKGGQRWVVIPFRFCQDGMEFRVSMRVFLESGQMSDRSVFMALDIAQTGGGNSRGSRQLFVLEAADGRVARLSAYVQSALPPRAQSSLEQELSRLFEIPLERVSVKPLAGGFPFESGFGEDLLRPIDEAV